jgi:paired amphipathic helix protein Sin3a
MRPFFITVGLTLGATVSSQLVVPLVRSASINQLSGHGQVPLMDPNGPGPVVPPSDAAPAESPSGGVVLSDAMGRDRSINLFAGYAPSPSSSVLRRFEALLTDIWYPSFVRDIESASRRLDDPSLNTTVLAPLNSAIEKLPRKPWEEPSDYDALGPNAYEGGDGQERAQRNLRRFVEAHLIPATPWPQGKKLRPIGGDQEIWWEEKDGTRMVRHRIAEHSLRFPTYVTADR